MRLLTTPLPLRHRPSPLSPGALLGRLHIALRHALAQWRRLRDAHRMARSLAELDDRTLRDLGLHRSEISSMAAEVSGFARIDRTHALLSLNRGC